MPDKELRIINFPTVHPLEIREDGDKGLRIVGYTATFNQETEIGGYFREVIRPGFFSKALRENQDVRALFNHNSDNILARSKSGTLSMKEDQHGLWVEIEPADTQMGRDLVTSIRRGDISGMSFAFTIQKQTWTEEDEGMDLRELLEIKQLFDVGPVVYPAYDQTTAEVKSEFRSGEDIWKERQCLKGMSDDEYQAVGLTSGYVEWKARRDTTALPAITTFTSANSSDIAWFNAVDFNMDNISSDIRMPEVNTDFPSLRGTLIPDRDGQSKKAKARERELRLLELENGI